MRTTASGTPVHTLTPSDHSTAAVIAAFLEAQLHDSRQQAEKETGQGKAFFQGRVSAFELALSGLRTVAQ